MHRSEVFGWLFDVGVDVLATSLGKVSGIVTAQLGDSTAGKADSDSAELWQQTGFYSRPAPPSAGGASCQGLVLKSGDRDIVFATSDKRSSQIYGNLAPGEACVFATVGQARSVWKADGSVRHMTTDDNTASGNAMYYGMSSGSAKSVAKGGEWRVYAPFGGCWQDMTGYHQRYWFGGADDVGVSQIPGVPVQTSTRTLSYDFITLDGAFVAIGRSNGVGIPDGLVQVTVFAGLMAAFATATGVMVGLLGTALTDIATQLSSLGKPAASVAPSVTGLATWAAAANTAFASLLTTVSTRSTTAT